MASLLFSRRFSWFAAFILSNTVLAMLVGLRYLPWISVPDTLTAGYVALVYLGQFMMLAALWGSPLLLLITVSSRPLPLLLISAGWAALGLALLLLDTQVYSIYRFHLSGFVVGLVLGAGSHIFAFGWQAWLMALAGFAGLLVVEGVLAWALWRWLPRARMLTALMTLGMAALVSAHLWHAWADANYEHRITSLTRHIPLYYAATAKRFMSYHGLVDPQRARDNRQEMEMGEVDGRAPLKYPLSPLACTAPQRLPNVLFIVMDSARWDMIDPRWTPGLAALAEKNLNFSRHYSNGNATKPGIFSLFYGLPSNYWDAFSAQRRPPVLIQRMQQLNYQTMVLSSATLVSPAFDKNVFSSISDLRLTTPGREKWVRDVRITDDWLAFIRQRQEAGERRPFFGFLFYDTTHGYQVPDDYPVQFQPAWEPVNRLDLGPSFNPELVSNNYKSTLHFVDRQIQRVTSDLAQRGLLDNTIVIITSDHGEEFNDYGMNYWGHGSNFGDYQLRVPLIVLWPGKEAEAFSHRSEHFDVAPTLMSEALGCAATDPSSYAIGHSLFAPPQRQWSIAHSYMDQALLLPDMQLVTHAYGDTDVLDEQLKPLKEYQVDPNIVAEVLAAMSRFYKE